MQRMALLLVAIAALHGAGREPADARGTACPGFGAKVSAARRPRPFDAWPPGRAPSQSAAPAPSPDPSGKPMNGVRLSLARHQPGGGAAGQPSFRVAIENVGSEDVVLNLGWAVGNHRFQSPLNLSFHLTDPEGKTRALQFTDRRYGGIGGRVDDYIVPLRTRSIYTMIVGLDDFWSPDTKEFGVKLASGRYRLTAQIEAGEAKMINSDTSIVRFLPFWKGTLRSNVLEFEQR
jgi:hypothetical protein